MRGSEVGDAGSSAVEIEGEKVDVQFKTVSMMKKWVMSKMGPMVLHRCTRSRGSRRRLWRRFLSRSRFEIVVGSRRPRICCCRCRHRAVRYKKTGPSSNAAQTKAHIHKALAEIAATKMRNFCTSIFSSRMKKGQNNSFSKEREIGTPRIA